MGSPYLTPETALSAQEQGERSEFQARLDTVSPNAPLTSLIVAINVIYFVLMALNGAGWIVPNGEETVRWGSNFGPVTLDGQWWRLFTSTFIHFGLIHLALNMFALYETGRLAERIYGSVHFLLLYVLSGVAGSIVSLLWHPQINSAGASGAIFGVFGGLLVFVLNAKNAMPSSIMKEHRNSTVVFIAYNLFYGFTHAGIDNGAHIGGLLGGMAFGWLLSRPLDIIARTKLLTPRFLGSIAASLVLLAAISYPLTHPSGDVMYDQGEGVPKDSAEAVKWYRKAAEQGDAVAQFNLGNAYVNGDGVPKDSAEAEKWYRKSAEQGDAPAQFSLGFMYDNGDGVPKDSVEAVKWYRKAAEQGDANAQVNLGVMYYNGDGVPKDFVQSHVWWNIAGANGDEDAKKNLAKIEPEMTAEQIAEATKLARELFEKMPKK